MKTLFKASTTILVISLIVYAFKNNFFAENMNKKAHPLVIAHRGASAYAPENTLAAVGKALEFSSDMVEVDIHLSKDGELVVIHDATLERTTSGEGRVDAYDMTSLKKLDAGSWFGEAFKDEKIPTLREVMELIDKKAVVLIEIKKGSEGNYEGIEQKTVDLVRALKAESWVIIQSFESEVVANTHAIAPDLEVHQLITGSMASMPLYHNGQFQFESVFSIDHVQAINPYYKTTSQAFINEVHKRGMKVFTYTVNEEEDIQKMISMGVDGIITNYPDRVK